MDYCVDCGNTLRDNYCPSCKMIYDISYSKHMHCKYCGNKMIVPQSLLSKTRYICNFCQYQYFFTEHYVDDTAELEEFLQSVERNCDECGSKMIINNLTEELVCTNCGLIYDAPITIS